MHLTEEQRTIIRHPLGMHARVLAVAGSGKTTTMVQRVKYLVTELKQAPQRILVVMFNKLAREDFQKKIEQEIFDEGLRPKIYTFHALAYKLRRDADRQIPTNKKMEEWFGGKEELALIEMHRVIDSLVQEGRIDSDIDPKDALDAIGEWKASLIPPGHAGHRRNPDLPIIYQRFEEHRHRRVAITFDDFIPDAMKLFERHSDFKRRWSGRMQHIIVDEYQDINYGQQQLIRLLAGNRADVMVVGDDDQTIYEWRSARPYYILQGFEEDFTNKQVKSYTLSRSFRFGPILAQCAFNAIRFNSQRYEKPLIADNVMSDSDITVISSSSGQETQQGIQIGQEISTLVRKMQVSPQKIVVLGRTFSQLEGLQITCLRHKIPFRVMGMSPFFGRSENRTLIDYIRLAMSLNLHARAIKEWKVAYGNDSDENNRRQSYRRTRSRSSLAAEAVRMVLAVANTPSRKLPRKYLQAAIEQGALAGKTILQSLNDLLKATDTPLRHEQCETLGELLDFLQRINERILGASDLKAVDLLQWIVKHTEYEEHYTRYYGQGEASTERIESVKNFITFAQDTALKVEKFIEHIELLDPSRGLPPEKTITMTTVHRTKGLEYDYVFIPNCTEGNIPVHMGDESYVYDTTGAVPEHPPSPPIESERRLFYVAATRAKKHLYIGTISPSQQEGIQSQSHIPLPSRFIEEIQLDATKEAIKNLLHDTINKSWDEKLTNISGRHSGVLKRVIQNYQWKLQEKYPIHTINHTLEQLPELSFQYKLSYPDIDTGKTSQKLQENVTPPWSDPWDEIGTTL